MLSTAGRRYFLSITSATNDEAKNPNPRNGVRNNPQANCSKLSFPKSDRAHKVVVPEIKK